MKRIGIILGILVLFSIPIIVNIYDYTLLDASDMLSYFATILSALGTVYLGYVAIRQNDRLMKLEKDTYISSHSCDIILCNNEDLRPKSKRLSNEICLSYNEDYTIDLTISNYGGSVLSQIELDFGNNNFFSSHLVIAPNEQKKKFIGIPKTIAANQKIKATFISCYGIKTYGDFEVNFSDEDIATIRYYHYYGLNKENIQ